MSEEAKQESVEEKAVVETPDVVTDEDRNVAGDKEYAVDSDSMAVESEKSDVPEGEGAFPELFVTEGKRHRVEVDILTSKIDGSLKSVSNKDMETGLDFKKDFGYLRHTEAWFDFTLPTYEEMATYRKRCSVYRREAGQMMVDKLQLRNFLLVWHLKDWSMVDKNGKIELKHDEDGSLSQESMEKMYALHPTLIDVVMTVFEKNLLLT